MNDAYGFPIGHKTMTPVYPPGKKPNGKQHVVFTEWVCECGARVSDVRAHRVAYGMADRRVGVEM